MAVNTPVSQHTAIVETLRRYWGYDQLRPLQLEAIEAGLQEQDSLVVLPTGGGKSMCYAIPPVVAERTDVVVSPLIALMKDQVDALTVCGYPAAALHSGMSEPDRRLVEAGIAAGKYRLLFVAPERLLTPWFLAAAQRANIRSFAIDEAHCISQWGHDFRPEYRRLATLKQAFPEAAIHAFTATATKRVRLDIIAQLGLRQPKVLIGKFDRANLVYRIEQRRELDDQVLQVIRRHANEAIIVYCISRADTERLAGVLRTRGVKAAAYHAGLDPNTRAKTQEQFAAEKLDVVVATVAFGMGIDRSNVRCVIHTALPKSLEQYQQETGRAGRDGLEAECVLLTASADMRRWESLMTRSAGETGQTPENLTAQLELLRDMQQFANSHHCRHKDISEYFGQDYEAENCGACDVCLGETAPVEDATEAARTVLACVVALGYPYGMTYVAEVLCGAKSKRIQERGHDSLALYGALRAMPKEAVQNMILQLVEQRLLDRSSGDRPVLTLTAAAQGVLNGTADVMMSKPKDTGRYQPAVADAAWEDVDRGLFEHLRELRRTVADERSVPAFVILGDATLRELARLRPVELAAFGQVRGVGERKLADLGSRFVAAIAGYCRENGLSTNQTPKPVQPVTVYAPKVATPARGEKLQAYAMFDCGDSVGDVSAAIGRAHSTVSGYLEDYVAERKPVSLAAWVDDAVYQRVKTAAADTGGSYLRPVFEALDGEIGYDVIRIVMRHAGLR